MGEWTARNNSELLAKGCFVSMRDLAERSVAFRDRSAPFRAVELVPELHVGALQCCKMLRELRQSNFETVHALEQRGRFLSDF